MLSIIGSCKITIEVPTKAPQTLTFLVVASNIDYEIQLHIFDYSLFGLDPDAFFPTRPKSWPGTPKYYRPLVMNPGTQQLRLENRATDWSLPRRRGPPVASGISPPGVPRPMSDWLAADDDETGRQAEGWSDNGMAP